MAKLLDCIALTIITFALTFVWTALLFDGAAPALIMSCTLTLIAVISIRYVRGKTGKPYSYDRLALEFAIRGNEYVISLLISAFPAIEMENTGKNYILLKDSAIVSNFKLAALGISDLGAACVLAKKLDRKRVFLICHAVDRRAYTVAQIEGVKLTPVKIRAVYRLLKKRGALPDLKPVKEKLTFKAFFGVLLSRANFKSYAFSGAVLILTSFITPLKIYYIVAGSASLLLAAITLTPLGKGNFYAPKLEEELTNELSSPPNQISIDDLS